MFKKLLLLCVASITLQVVTPSAQLIASQNNSHWSWRLVSSIGRDVLSVTKGIGFGVWSGMQFTGGLCNNYLQREHIYAALGAMGAYALYNYFNAISRIHNKYKSKKITLDVGGREVHRFSNWEIEKWASHVDIMDKDSDVLNFITSQSELSRQNPETAFTMDEMLMAVQQEIQEIEDDMKKLEDDFVVYFKFLSGLPIIGGEYGIKAAYKSLHLENELYWTKQQLTDANTLMRNLCSNSWWHYVCKINYGNAAEVWWKLKKRRLRLKAFEYFLIPVEAGRSNVPDRNRSLRRDDHGVRAQVQLEQR